ncbi:MAG: hypothetical protein QOJ16_1158 [Acidobacteriota bacterium]|jgi:uncharacterized damage-inducible protein DinB|nr:hypothetical protein [Acidobacteriota bacterium]
MSDDKPLRDHLLSLLKDGHAHAGFDPTVADLAPEHRGVRPPGAPHSAWQLLEHLRLAQSDILEFSRDPKHVSPKWPEGYWPQDPAPPTEQAWDESVAAFRRDSQALQDLVADSKSDLYTPFPWGKGQTLLREALLAADHNSYHLGQLVLVRRLLGAWKEE